MVLFPLVCPLSMMMESGDLVQQSWVLVHRTLGVYCLFFRIVFRVHRGEGGAGDGGEMERQLREIGVCVVELLGILLRLIARLMSMILFLVCVRVLVCLCVSLSVSVCLCVCVPAYVRVSVCPCVRVSSCHLVCLYACFSVCLHAYVSLSLFLSLSFSLSLLPSVGVCLCVHVRICAWYVQVYRCICACMYVSVCVCVCMRISFRAVYTSVLPDRSFL